MDPNFRSIVNLAKQYDTKMNINTNGSLLDLKMNQLMMPYLYDVKVSYDGAIPETFEKIRSGLKHAKTFKNIQNFITTSEEIENQQIIFPNRQLL